ncbi:MAG: hypothetical protein GY920_09820 [Aliivibrio sp.]|nr:hypothetical protein [Aliivibrio sp.]
MIIWFSMCQRVPRRQSQCRAELPNVVPRRAVKISAALSCQCIMIFPDFIGVFKLILLTVFNKLATPSDGCLEYTFIRSKGAVFSKILLRGWILKNNYILKIHAPSLFFYNWVSFFKVDVTQI